MKTRHKLIYGFFKPLVKAFLKLKFGYRFTKAENLPESYIVLSNHNTDFDPLLVGVSFKRQMYFVASEHILRWKRAARFIKFGFDPISRSKGTTAASTVMEIMRRIRAGGRVCIFAEGNRSWDGVTNPILPSTGKLVKAAKCALVTYKLVGGYFISPNWSGMNTRRGRFTGAPVNIYSKEQLASMSVDEINAAIERDLYEDAYARQLADPAPYRGKRLAEKLENLLFVCPECGGIDTFTSLDDGVKCSACGLGFKYNEFGMLEGAPYKTVKEWSDYQKQWMRDAVEARSVRFSDPEALVTEISNHEASSVAEGALRMDTRALTVGEVEFRISDISSLAMHGRRAMVFTVGDSYYELNVGDGRNAYKYLLLYNTIEEVAR